MGLAMGFEQWCAQCNKYMGFHNHKESMSSHTDTTLPMLIKNIRLSLGETQRIFGERFGVSTPLVCQWEKGYREPNADVFMFLLNQEIQKAREERDQEIKKIIENISRLSGVCQHIPIEDSDIKGMKKIVEFRGTWVNYEELIDSLSH